MGNCGSTVMPFVCVKGNQWADAVLWSSNRFPSFQRYKYSKTSILIYSFPDFMQVLYCPSQIPIRTMLNFNRSYSYWNLHFSWICIQFFKSWQWKFVQFYIYNIPFQKCRRNAGAVTLMSKICHSRVDTLHLWKILNLMTCWQF